MDLNNNNIYKNFLNERIYNNRKITEEFFRKDSEEFYLNFKDNNFKVICNLQWYDNGCNDYDVYYTFGSIIINFKCLINDCFFIISFKLQGLKEHKSKKNNYSLIANSYNMLLNKNLEEKIENVFNKYLIENNYEKLQEKFPIKEINDKLIKI